MIDVLPEDDSAAFQLGGVFDETTSAPKTGQEIVDECLEFAATLRERGEPLPEVLQRAEREAALEEFVSGRSGCFWLAERRPLGRLEEVVEHWRRCATCQAAARAERQARRRPEPGGHASVPRGRK